jgi:hypothetical protein
MKKYISLFAVCIALFLTTAFLANNKADEWVSLFDGKTLTNWKVGDNAATFSVQDGTIAVHGETAHLFYDGPVQQF